MILVLLGTQNNSFERLLNEIEKLVEKNIINEEVIVQAGYTKYQSDKIKILDLVSKEELEELENQANLIITHGGVGSITSALSKGKKVIAIPRLHKFKEHVNNHQKEIVQLFNQKGYLMGIDDVEQLEQTLLGIQDFKPVKYEKNNEQMLNIIQDFIDKV